MMQLFCGRRRESAQAPTVVASGTRAATVLLLQAARWRSLGWSGATQPTQPLSAATLRRESRLYLTHCRSNSLCADPSRAAGREVSLAVSKEVAEIGASKYVRARMAKSVRWCPFTEGVGPPRQSCTVQISLVYISPGVPSAASSHHGQPNSTCAGLAVGGSRRGTTDRVPPDSIRFSPRSDKMST